MKPTKEPREKKGKQHRCPVGRCKHGFKGHVRFSKIDGDWKCPILCRCKKAGGFTPRKAVTIIRGIRWA
jgi:rubredoxin